MFNSIGFREKPRYLHIFPCFFYGISIPTVKKIYRHPLKRKKSWRCPLFFGLPFHKCYSFSVMDELPCQHYTADFLLSALDFTSGSRLAHTLFTLWGHSCCVFDCYLKSLDLQRPVTDWYLARSSSSKRPGVKNRKVYYVSHCFCECYLSNYTGRFVFPEVGVWRMRRWCHMSFLHWGECFRWTF